MLVLDIISILTASILVGTLSGNWLWGVAAFSGMAALYHPGDY